MKPNRNLLTFAMTLILLISCSNGMISCAENDITSNNQQNRPGMPSQGGPGGQFGGFGQSVEIIDDGSTTNYVDTTTASAK